MNNPPQIKIASPCHARWEDMDGDDKSRFCDRCQKHVYNFPSMKPSEVLQLIEAKEGKLCARLYKRFDGTVLAANCPEGQERAATKWRLACLSILGAAALLFVARLASATSGEKQRTITRAERLWEEAVWRMKGLLGIQPPAVLMGEVCVPPPSKNNNTNNSVSIQPL